MRTSTLKKATLVNKGVWTTTITWSTILLSNDIKIEDVGKTCITIEQKYYRSKETMTKTEIFEQEKFDEAYERFHELLKKWL